MDGLFEPHPVPTSHDPRVELGGWSAVVERACLRVEGEGTDADWWRVAATACWRHLDEVGYETGPYDLQVSSPGLERPLRRPEHFRRTGGRQVQVKTTAPMAGSRTHTGTLRAADEEGITLEVDGDERRVPHADIASARTVVDWGAELKGSNA